VFALGLEFLLIALLHDGHIYDWERALTRLLQRLPTSEDFLRAINFLTNTLSLEFLALFTMVLAMVYLLGWRLDAWLLLLTFPLHVLAQFPKALIDRPRPSPAYEGIEGVGGFQSFPSGHAEFVITFWGFLAIVACAHLVRRWQRIVVLVAWLVLALTTGVLRIAMGRHWPIDVFASYLIGLGILSGLVWLRRSLRIAIVTNDYRRPTPDAGSAQVQES
jgi:membrane-associated phospholipid phosphatase